jgi:hypothetical protein
MHDEDALLALAARQHGLAHQKQITKLGIPRSGIDHLVRTGRWLRRSPHILQSAGAPSTPEQATLLAVLDLNPEGAAISYNSAAARWGLPGFRLRPLHVTGDRVRGRNDHHVAIVHQPRLLLPEHVLQLDGIPTTSPGRTLFDLAGTLKWEQQLERTVDNALASGLTSITLLRRLLTQLGRRGRPGIARMRRLLDPRPLDYRPFGSSLESRFLHVASGAGYRNFVKQLDVGSEYDWIGRVDFVDRAHKVIVEVQSDRFHGAQLDAERDAVRVAALRAAGWSVVQVREHDVWYEPGTVVAQLRRAFA